MMEKDYIRRKTALMDVAPISSCLFNDTGNQALYMV